MRECGRAGNYRLDTYRSKQRLEEKKKAIRKKTITTNTAQRLDVQTNFVHLNLKQSLCTHEANGYC